MFLTIKYKGRCLNQCATCFRNNKWKAKEFQNNILFMILMFDATVNNIAVVISTYILFILDLINMGKYVPKYLKYFHIKKHVFLRVNCYITTNQCNP